MKKYGIILYVETDNLGDDIQTYAASKLLPNIDYIIDRENMDSFASKKNEPVYCIFNGWFLYNTVNWPPSKNIIPLPISMHITDSMSNYIASRELFKERAINYFDYFSNYGVGCRDSATMKYLSEKTFNTYLSYCVTLTLKKFDIKKEENDYICLVDVSDAVRDYVYNNADCEIREYTHDYRNNTFEDIPFEQRMKNVEDRLKIYQNAKCVITSRYHAAMPCLALETPVALIPSKYEPSRYDDLKELFCICDEKSFISGSIFDISNPKQNSIKYLDIVKKLQNKVNEFINDDSIVEPYIEETSYRNQKEFLIKLEELYTQNQNLKIYIYYLFPLIF